MAYKEIERQEKRLPDIKFDRYTLEYEALDFIRNACEGLRFDESRLSEHDAADEAKKHLAEYAAAQIRPEGFTGNSREKNSIPFNLEKDIDRLCLENSLKQFIVSGAKEDAFNVYFCYLEMFIGDYEKTRRMIELLSEYEANGSGLLMKHRDHYSHSVYVFTLGLAIYNSNSIFRSCYKKFYGLTNEHKAAHHFLRYWGLASLFHDIGYPFEIPFEQASAYFEVNNDKRSERPFISYNAMDSYKKLSDEASARVSELLGISCRTTDRVFARVLRMRLSTVYPFTENYMADLLSRKPSRPQDFNFFMDHAYFSATVLFNKLFCEMSCEMTVEALDALSAILMHNSLYKFDIAKLNRSNIPFRMELHPLAYILMLCDELQCWDRVAYGRNSRRELHPMSCRFDFSGNNISAHYIFDVNEKPKIEQFEQEFAEWKKNGADKKAEPKLKAFSSMYTDAGKSKFVKDIEEIVDLTDIRLSADTVLADPDSARRHGTLSNSNFIHLYNFAVVLNGRWDSQNAWKEAKKNGTEEKFISDPENRKNFMESFKSLSLEYKLSNINQAKAFGKYIEMIGCFYTDRSVDFELVTSFTSEQTLIIGRAEHRRWLQEHYDMGWTYGEPPKALRDCLRTHLDMIPDLSYDDLNDSGCVITPEMANINYGRLGKDEQDKDTEPMECMMAMMKMFDGIRIYRLK